MSEAYIVNSMGKCQDWSLNQDQFIEELVSKWAQVEVKRNVSDAYIMRWAVKIESFSTLGGIQSDYQTLTIDGGEIAHVAEFVLWYRTFIPEQYPLFLYKGSTFANPIELKQTTSKEELIKTLISY